MHAAIAKYHTITYRNHNEFTADCEHSHSHLTIHDYRSVYLFASIQRLSYKRIANRYVGLYAGFGRDRKFEFTRTPPSHSIP